ncbi:MAG: L-serine ammonia-lyase, iron-sulfur-dependent subunit beta [Clostridiales bacterium]|jgi:L-serine dehydratase|nr:L-serine ammonia-lyase, iron-sulfur-dependent subunit beta [Clostridiales bacterium]
MDLFDIIGPIMVGPSSSHTAGVVRIGNVVRKILDAEPKDIVVKFHGSFSTTYKGHGSDKAIIGGIMGFKADDPRIRGSLEVAKSSGIAYSFETITLKNAHPNSIVVQVKDKNGNGLKVIGESVGGGNIVIRRINDTVVELTGEYDTIITNHHDEPGVVSLVANVLAFNQINIANMRVFRSAKGGGAIMVIETDGIPDKGLAKTLAALPSIMWTSIIRGGK